MECVEVFNQENDMTKQARTALICARDVLHGLSFKDDKITAALASIAKALDGSLPDGPLDVLRLSGPIDSNDSAHWGIPLWVVGVKYKGLADIQCIKIRDQSNGDPHVWGYSEWRRSPGFRTLGISLATFRDRFVSCRFYCDHDAALAAIKTASTPSPKLAKEMLREKAADDARKAAYAR